jgi:hypothetical protein
MSHSAASRETPLKVMVEVVVRRAHNDINFQFAAATRAGAIIQTALRPDTRLAIFLPGNLQPDPRPCLCHAGEGGRPMRCQGHDSETVSRQEAPDERDVID